jgi:hypothetical protein
LDDCVLLACDRDGPASVLTADRLVLGFIVITVVFA